VLTVTQAAQRAGVSRSRICGWIVWGHLPAVLSGHRLTVSRDDLLAVQEAAQGWLVEPRWQRNPTRAGQRLRLLREAAGLSQQELALASGLTHEEISRLELGYQTPLLSTVRTLAQALGVDPSIFVARTKLAPIGLTTDAVAARLEVPRGRVKVWLRTGKLAGVKVSGQWRVPLEAVLDLERRDRLRGTSRRLDPRYRG
jgi:excisionase family DNA binding protein